METDSNIAAGVEILLKLKGMHPFFFVRVKGSYLRVEFADIRYIESTGNYVKLVTDKQTFQLALRIHRLEEELPPELFCRIHRSFIVAIHKIDSFNNEDVYMGAVTLPIGMLYRSMLQSRVRIFAASHIRAGKTAFLKESFINGN